MHMTNMWIQVISCVQTGLSMLLGLLGLIHRHIHVILSHLCSREKTILNNFVIKAFALAYT